MSQRKKFYYLTGGSLEEFTGKIKFSDFVREGSDYILSVSDVQSKKEVYVKMSDHDITNITGTSESKPKIFQLKYYKNGNKYMNVYYEFLHTEKHVPMNGLNENGLNGIQPNCPNYPHCLNHPNCPHCLNSLVNTQLTNTQLTNTQLNNTHLYPHRHRNRHNQQNQQNDLMKNKFIQEHKTKFITKIISLTEDDVFILKLTIKKVLKSPIFKQIFEYTDLKENLEYLFR